MRTATTCGLSSKRTAAASSATRSTTHMGSAIDTLPIFMSAVSLWANKAFCDFSASSCSSVSSSRAGRVTPTTTTTIMV